MSRRGRVWVVTCAFATALLAVSPAAARPDPPVEPGGVAHSPGTFSGGASADVVRANLSIPDYLIVQDFLDGGGPSAQAVLDSLGVSRGFASFPYPGEVGVAATGLVSILTGFSLPSYPFLASSDHPVQPSAEVDQPGLHLHATSDETSSEASAGFGESADGAGGGGFADASVTVDDDGTITAKASSRAGLTIGSVTIDGVRAEAAVTRSADDIDRSSSLVVGEIDIAGVGVSLTDRGLVLAGTPLIPIDVVTGLTDALSIGDTTIEFLPETVTEDSVISAGLRISVSQMVEAIGHPVNVSYTIGQAFATANGSTFPVSVALSPPLPEPPAPTTAAPAPSPLSIPAASLDSGSALDAPEALAPPTDESAAPPTEPLATRTGVPVRLSGWSMYPILILAGTVLCTAVLGARFRAREPSWSS